MKIKDKNLWELSIKRFEDVFKKYPSTPEEIATVTAIYRKQGGMITVDRTEKIYEIFYSHRESLRTDVKSLLQRYISNPVVLGIALYFLLNYLKKFVK